MKCVIDIEVLKHIKLCSASSLSHKNRESIINFLKNFVSDGFIFHAEGGHGVFYLVPVIADSAYTACPLSASSFCGVLSPLPGHFCSGFFL